MGIIFSEILNKLALAEGDKLFLVETEKVSFELTPYNQAVKDTLEVAKGVVRRYRNAFKELAK